MLPNDRAANITAYCLPVRNHPQKNYYYTVPNIINIISEANPL